MEDLYVKTKGKKRIDKNVYTYEEVTSAEYKGDYGRLLQKGYVIFDFDEQPYVDKIVKIITTSNLKCRMLKTTRGVHFLFKTNYNKIACNNKQFIWLGLLCDIKGVGLEEEGKQCYQALKVDGKIREEICLNHNASDGIEVLDYAPKWLYHAPKNIQRDLTIDQTGNRNDMFHHDMIKAKKNNFSYEEYYQMANIINDNVLPEGLQEYELKSATRRTEWEKIVVNEATDETLLLDMALDVIDYWNCRISRGSLIFFDESAGHYSNNESILERYLQEKYKAQNITKGRIREVRNQMDLQLFTYKKYQCERNSEYVVCKDKLVSMWQDEIKDMTRTIVTDVVYPYSIMTQKEFDNYDGIGKKFLQDISCNNEEIETVICECLGCMLAPTNHFGKIFIWYGNGANGKTVLVKIMQTIMGDLLTNCNILKINDRFTLSRAYKGIANITDDVGVTTIKETGLLKSIIDGSEIEIERKYYDPIKWQPNSQFVMCCNQVPSIKDTTKGMLRRLAFIPFDMQLKENEIDRDLFNKILGTSIKLEEKDKNDNALRYIMTKAIFAYRKAYSNGSLTVLEKQSQLLNEFEEENKDSISMFYDFLLEREGDLNGLCKWLDGKTTEEVFINYRNFRGVEVAETQRSFAVRFNRKLPHNIRVGRIKVSGVTATCYELI